MVTRTRASRGFAVKKTPEKKQVIKLLPRPTVGEMVETAIEVLAETKGSSLYAIKKYIAASYDVDIKKRAIYIRKYLISAVDAGVLIRTSGTGAAGSFKFSKKHSSLKSKTPKTDDVESKIEKECLKKMNGTTSPQALKKSNASKKYVTMVPVHRCSKKETMTGTYLGCRRPILANLFRKKSAASELKKDNDDSKLETEIECPKEMPMQVRRKRSVVRTYCEFSPYLRAKLDALAREAASMRRSQSSVTLNSKD